MLTYLIPILSLLVLAGMPMLLVTLLGHLGRPSAGTSGVSVDHLFSHSLDDKELASDITLPLVYSARTSDESHLREIILGARFLPIEQIESLLRKYARSRDPELQLYSQSIHQQALAQLPSTYLHLKGLASLESPALIASLLSAGLRLHDASFTPASERLSIIQALQIYADQILQMQEMTHPRLAYETGRFYLRVGQVESAKLLFERLPKGSPLHNSAIQRLSHREAIARVSSEIPTC